MKNLKYKSQKKFCAFAAATVAVCFGAAIALTAGIGETQTAEAAYYTVSSDNSSLVLPADYSQYLNLTAPTACAVSAGYLAISDGSTIYIYDKIAKTYSEYLHEYNTDDALNNVAQVDFGDDGFLYFTDASTYLYKLNLVELFAERTGITCTTFACESSTVYFATIVNGRVTIASVPSEELDMTSVSSLYTLNTYSAPAICCDSVGNLYFTDGRYLYDRSANAIKALPVNDAVTACKYINGRFYICDSTGRFSVYNYAADSVEKYYDGNYCNIDYYGGSLYTVNSASVQEFDCDEQDFTDYRICSSSSAVGRLSGACDATLVGSKLIIAENGNARITIYDGEKGDVSVFSPDFIPAYVAADSGDILVCGSGSFGIYDYSGKNLYISSELDRGEEIRGATNVYGAYYVVTSGNTFIKITETDGIYSEQKISKQLTGVGDSLSSDVYGNLIVKMTSGAVYTFSEDAFMSGSESGTLKYTFPAEVHSFFADYRGDVFGASGSAVISDCGITVSVSSAGCVYQADETPIKIAASFESRGGYIIYKNYAVYADNIGAPTLNDISTETSQTLVYRQSAADLKTVNIRKNAVEIFFDFSKYKSASTFPYTSHERLSEDSKAVVISETSSYYIVGAVSEKTHKYKTGIVLKNSCELLDSSSVQYSPEEYSGVGFVTNDVPLYRYACFASEIGSLEKGAEVVISYAINLGSGYNFCRIEYSYNGAEYSGYIPLAYLIPSGETAETKATVSYAYIDVEDEYYTLLADDGSTLNVSTKEKFTVTGDPYAEDEVKLSYSSDGKTYYTIVDSSLLKTNNSEQIRIFAIIIISVVIVLIVVNYTVFTSRRKKKAVRDEDDF